MTADDFGRLLDLAVKRFSRDGTTIEVERNNLELRVASALQEVERAAGGALCTETFTHRWAGPTVLHLVRPIGTELVGSPAAEVWAITNITERRSRGDAPVLLGVGDYHVVDKWRLERRPDGANPAWCWGAEVVISYSAEVDRDLRDRVCLDLLALDLSFSPHRRQQMPDWSLDFGSGVDQAARRRELLAQISEGARATII